MSKKDWVWMPHAGHLIVGYKCRFVLNTYIGDYIVSTVGEYYPSDSREMDTIGFDRFYETMVFEATREKDPKAQCCPWRMTGDSLDLEGYNDPVAAYRGHLALCEKWVTRRIMAQTKLKQAEGTLAKGEGENTSE